MSAQSDIAAIGQLPELVKETSGLLFYNGKIITHNDSGNAPELYEIDPTELNITRTVTVNDVVNTDWEDITQDENYIYIGNFGNNNGDRQDLHILKISKSDYDNRDSVTAERIDFLYEDQVSFDTMENSDFDAEAFFVLGDDLIILTKQWQSQGTVAYRVPKLPGAFLAERLDTYQVDGLVTGATYNSATNELFLVGYNQFLFPFFVAIANIQTEAIFLGEKVKTNLSIGAAQIEAITLFGNNQFYVSSEEFINPPLVTSFSRLFSFSLDSEEEENPIDPIPISTNEVLVVFKTYGAQTLSYSLNTDRIVVAMGVFDATGKLIKYVPLERIRTAPIDISSLNQSLYYLTFFLVDGELSAPFFKD